MFHQPPDFAFIRLCQFQQGRHCENTTSHVGAHWLSQPILTLMTRDLGFITSRLERVCTPPNPISEIASSLPRNHHVDLAV